MATAGSEGLLSDGQKRLDSYEVTGHMHCVAGPRCGGLLRGLPIVGFSLQP